nr:hypothetical protein [Tanacetum cinerariifolium]
MPLKRDLRLIDEYFESVSVDVISNIAPSHVKTVKTIDVNHKGLFNTEEPKHVMKNNFSPPIIKDWYSDDESEVEISPTVEVKIIKAGIEKIKFVKTVLERAKVYYECMEPFKSLMCIWVRSRSIAATWLEKMVTPLIVPAIKVEFRRISLTGFRSCISNSQTRASQSRQTRIMRRTLELFLDFTVCEGSSTLEDCALVGFID